jgi:alpha-beta hydrolase superfamily lysophospholipase
MLKTLEDTAKRNSGIHHPLQMMIPLQDRVVDPNATLQFFRELKLRDKYLKTYPGFLHEPFNEIGKEQVFEDLEKWILSQTDLS